MSDKPVAGLVTAIIVAPLVVLCCAAPLLAGSIITALTTWIGAIDPVTAVLVGILSAIAIGIFLKWRKRNFETSELMLKGRQ